MLKGCLSITPTAQSRATAHSRLFKVLRLVDERKLRELVRAQELVKTIHITGVA